MSIFAYYWYVPILSNCLKPKTYAREVPKLPMNPLETSPNLSADGLLVNFQGNRMQLFVQDPSTESVFTEEFFAAELYGFQEYSENETLIEYYLPPPEMHPLPTKNGFLFTIQLENGVSFNYTYEIVKIDKAYVIHFNHLFIYSFIRFIHLFLFSLIY